MLRDDPDHWNWTSFWAGWCMSGWSILVGMLVAYIWEHYIK